MNPFDLSGRIAVVTGANTGIGQALAVGLAGAGADVALVGRTPADETAGQIRQSLRQAFASAVTKVFFYSLFFIVAGFVTTLFIPELPLKKSYGGGPPVEM